MESNVNVAGCTKDAFVDVEVTRVEFSADACDGEGYGILRFNDIENNLVRRNITKCERVIVDFSLVKGEVGDWSLSDLL